MTIAEECAHHWIIGFEPGTDSPARCRRCKAERRFANADPVKTWRVTPCTKCKNPRSSFAHRKACDS
jgi:hypothetical protein